MPKFKPARTLLIVLLTMTGAINTPHADQAHSESHEESHARPGRSPQTVDYALILPANLPHILRFAAEKSSALELSAEQLAEIRELVKAAPERVLKRLAQAEALEDEIARAVLEKGEKLADLQEKIAQLVALKRGATEAQINTLNRLQTLLTPRQFKMTVQFARQEAQ